MPLSLADSINSDFTFKKFVDDSSGASKSKGGQGQQAAPQVFANAKVSHIQFGMLKSKDITKLSHIHVSHRMLYELNRRDPMKNGVLDRRMGTSDKKEVCTTCHKNLADCVGHFGHIELDLPVFHIGYMKDIVKILQTICKSCSRVLLPEDSRNYYIAKYSDGSLDKRSRSISSKDEILDVAKKCKRCHQCGASNGQVKKLPGIFKIVHELKAKESADDKHAFLNRFQTALRFNSSLDEHIGKALMDLSPYTVLKLFRNVLDQDCILLNMNPSIGRPEDMLVTHIPVPPVCIRPSVAMGISGSNEDDITVKLGDIVHINSFIRNAFEKGSATSVIIENWDYLQQQVAMVINSDLPGFNKSMISSKPIRSLTSRLKGKQGRFRGNLSGKRVDFSARTVISPDPNLRVDQVGIPEHVAKIMTFPERVNKYNITMLRRAVINGPDVHPGANGVEYADGTKVYLKYAKREETAARLKYGDVVERHLMNDDLCLFNRQPSLHKMSIMAHRARVLQGRTFRFNECVCAPYNADFDGDEMNVHLPQTLEAKAEARQLMAIQENLVTPRNGEPLVTPTQDFLTTAFLVTLKDNFFDRAQFCRLVSLMNDADEFVELPSPAIIKPVKLWTGKQLISILLRPNQRDDWPLLNIEYAAKNYERKDEVMCPLDGYVFIRNSELICGNLCKGGLGGSKKGMFYALVRDQHPLVAAKFMNRLAKFSSRYIGEKGFSIGISDVTPSQKLLNLKKGLLDNGYAKCAANIEAYQNNKLALQPGCDAEQSLESMCLGALSQIREDAGSECFKELDRLHNAPLIMAVCGSKGSKINISQMVACVGQQAVSGSRIPDGFVNRSLPHFPKFSKEPEAKGFVKNSFFSGLTATEFFMHTMGGREGLVDTAVKTAETGYMQRRLVKALEDLCVQYDGSVRTSERNVVQFKYGDDGLDPVMMTDNNCPVNFATLWNHCRATAAITASNAVGAGEATAVHAKSQVALKNKKWSLTTQQLQQENLKYFVATLKKEREALQMKRRFVETHIIGSHVTGKTVDESARSHVEDAAFDRELRQAVTEWRERRQAKVTARAIGKMGGDLSQEAMDLLGDGGDFVAMLNQELLPPVLLKHIFHFVQNPATRVPGADEDGGAFSKRFLCHFVEFMIGKASDMMHVLEMAVQTKDKEGKNDHSRGRGIKFKTDSNGDASFNLSSIQTVRKDFDAYVLSLLRLMPTPPKSVKLVSLWDEARPTRAAAEANIATTKEIKTVKSSSSASLAPSPSSLSSLSSSSFSTVEKVLPPSASDSWEGAAVYGSLGWHIFRSTKVITFGQLYKFLSGVFEKYQQAIIEPGTAVGAIGAQSIGEPGTQMTLKTFHFAGVASMNITLGVPRIKEIINASKKINTPIITAPLECSSDEKAARIVKGRIEKTILSEIAKRIDVVVSHQDAYIVVVLDRDTINALQLNVNAYTVEESLLAVKKLKLKDRIDVKNSTVLRILPPNLDKKQKKKAGVMDEEEEFPCVNALYLLNSIKAEVAGVIVQGISTVNRAVINSDTGNEKDKYNLIVEGYDLRRVMSTLGVRGRETTSNHLMEVEKVLGIEAARATIMREIHTTMESHGLSVDPRHVALLADIMSYRGEILGITRFGIAKMKESVMMLASFEKTADHLFEAAIRGTCDDVSGVSDSIIMGNPMPVGTGLFTTLQQSTETNYTGGVGIPPNSTTSSGFGFFGGLGNGTGQSKNQDVGLIGVGAERQDPWKTKKTLLQRAALTIKGKKDP